MATVAASTTSHYTHGQEEFGSSYYIGDLAYRYFKCLCNGDSAGAALMQMRSYGEVGDAWRHRKNCLTYNLYGDPKGRYKP